jgi:exodeoxyribonuclease V alpha subunit
MNGARAALLPALRREQALCTDARSGITAPLVLDGPRLYLARLWHKEVMLAQCLYALAAERCDPGPGMLARLHLLFDAQAADQRRACAIALTRRLGIVTGGPGTGKTTTVARMLVLLLEGALARDESPLVCLTAPTGKAAARAASALAEERKRLVDGGHASPQVAALLPQAATTLHRLLGARPDGSFRHGPGNPLAADVVVVDECSMVDLRLFEALVQALRPGARLVLLGDSNQLDAVEAGNVFGALCAGAGCVTPARAASTPTTGWPRNGIVAPSRQSTRADCSRRPRSCCSCSLTRIQLDFSRRAASMSRTPTHDGALTLRPSTPTTKPMLRRRERRSA